MRLIVAANNSIKGVWLFKNRRKGANLHGESLTANESNFMLSICIPIYNWDIRPLVTALHEQALRLNLECELFCLDDASNDAFRQINREIQNLPLVRYEELSQNIGRSAIRNQLAQRSQFENLLFMDGDSMPPDASFLQRYVAHFPLRGIVYGGRIYQSTPPTDPKLLFHWTYGIQREQRTAEQRRAAPYAHFMTNNYCVERAVALAIPFDESLVGYGHEDTLFGCQLAAQGIPIRHIDNPLLHVGLEDGAHFLAKTKEGLGNLARLLQRGAPIETRLIRTYQNLAKAGLHTVWAHSILLLSQRIEGKLLGQNPHLRLFDVYKLGWFCNLMKEAKKR